MGKIKESVEVKAESFIQIIKKGDFYEAQKRLSDFNDEQVEHILCLLAYDDNDFCSYAFAAFLVKQKDCIVFHGFARVVAEIGINYLNNAYAAAAYHARKIRELSLPNDPTNDGGLFSLGVYPETPLSKGEVISVANEILEQDPNDECALAALARAFERKDEPVKPACNVREQLEQFILEGKFSQATQPLSSFSQREIYALVFYLGCEERNLCAYAFTWYLILQKEEAELHYLAYRIATQAYAMTLTGCDAAGLFHLREAMRLEPLNEKYLEHFFLLCLPALEPCTLVSIDEIEEKAKQALDCNRLNLGALRALKKIGRYDSKYD